MALETLREKIRNNDARIAVIGLGYVGLPVACEFARVGYDVLGIDRLTERVEKINRGVSPIDGNEPGLADLLQQVIQTGRLHAASIYEPLRDRDVILIDVETPVDENHTPRYQALRSALTSLGPVLKDGALVIVESTIAPGTMREVVLPLLEQCSGKNLNEGFFLGNCPERVMPGKLLHNLRSLSRVVGGMSPETAECMVELYRHVVEADLDPADCITAELVKTVENAYRDVQIAFANEVALICEATGGDVWKVRELVNKSPYRQMHMPGAGVGGHCIPKDPWLLAYSARDKAIQMQLIPAARAVNDAMPQHVADLLEEALLQAGKELKGAQVLVMGYAYLEDSDDTRNSPSAKLVDDIQRRGATVVIHDPYVAGDQGDLVEKATGCDAAVVMVRHQEYLAMDLSALKAVMRFPVLVDGRHAFGLEKLQDSGWISRGVGQGDHRA
jgi:UDP-N-acetyl-D-mannosaminuronic acid dehydrogenase